MMVDDRIEREVHLLAACDIDGFEGRIAAYGRAAEEERAVAREALSRYVTAEPVTMRHYQENWAGELVLWFSLPHNSRNYLIIKPLTERIAHLNDVFVAPVMRRLGIASRMLKAASTALRGKGYNELHSDNVDSAALAVHRAVFGEENLRFYTSGYSGTRELPIDYDSAMRQVIQLEDMIARRQQGDYRSEQLLGVRVMLSEIDMTGWERAKQIGGYF